MGIFKILQFKLINANIEYYNAKNAYTILLFRSSTIFISQLSNYLLLPYTYKSLIENFFYCICFCERQGKFFLYIYCSAKDRAKTFFYISRSAKDKAKTFFYIYRSAKDRAKTFFLYIPLCER